MADKLYAYLSSESGAPDGKLMDRIMNDTDWRASDWLLGLPFELGYEQNWGLVLKYKKQPFQGITSAIS